MITWETWELREGPVSKEIFDKYAVRVWTVPIWVKIAPMTVY
jgi:hypothetical protein